ncbi:hypothetical protein [Loktanella sp. Alg231-35]|uniref:hypothetical protein n=1 Tax=Loktanella sp. Alg231-35 TaxID=1922220 RepID=UPI000D54D733|nr:hypothetical protein [Loktanella sp. Alg231-35]
MSRKFVGPAILALVVAAGCAPAIAPRDTPATLKDLSANTALAFEADFICEDLTVDEEMVERQTEDALVEMINAGYSMAQIDAMFVGLERDFGWLIPYSVGFERKHNIDIDDDAEFCRAMSVEQSSNSALGLMLI